MCLRSVLPSPVEEKAVGFAPWSLPDKVLDCFSCSALKKIDRANISDVELEGLQNLASDLLARNGRRLDEAVAAGALTEICHDYKN